jgi:hypothetical protein
LGPVFGGLPKIVGMLKDETAGTEISEFAGLRSKCYAVRIQRTEMNIDFNNAESSYTRSPYSEQSLQGRMPGLITSITKYIGGMLRSFVKDTRSSVVSDKVKKDKVMKKSVVAKEIMLEDYKDVLFTGKPQYRSMNTIRSELHNVYTITCNKLALSAHDDKRVIMDDRISTKAIGHYSTATIKKELLNDYVSAGSKIFTLYILPSTLDLYHHPLKYVITQPNVPRNLPALYNEGNTFTSVG